MNRKGNIIENLPGLLIAILGLAIIGFGIYQGILLYSQNVSEQKDTNAIAIVEQIKERIERLEEGNSGSFPVRGLKGWFLVVWGKDDPTKPNRCVLGSCICACEGKGELGGRAELCQDRGFCELIDVDTVDVHMDDYVASKDITGRPEPGSIQYNGKFYSYRERDFIIMPANLMDINIEKNARALSMNYESNIYKEIQVHLATQS